MTTECYFCKKPLTDDMVMDPFKDGNSAYEWDKNNPTQKRTVIGIQCPHCHISFCRGVHEKELKASFWSGFDKSICPSCGQLLKNILIIFQFVEKPISKTEALPTTIESEKSISHPDNITEGHPTQPKGSRIEEPKKLTSTSFVQSIIVLVFFGALTIYGVVSLFVLWDLGFSWILFSIGCLIFGGRLSYGAIQDIVKYAQQNKKE